MFISTSIGRTKRREIIVLTTPEYPKRISHVWFENNVDSDNCPLKAAVDEIYLRLYQRNNGFTHVVRDDYWTTIHSYMVFDKKPIKIKSKMQEKVKSPSWLKIRLIDDRDYHCYIKRNRQPPKATVITRQIVSVL